ncbi:T5orf172 domain-containing protein [Xylogone sp. PMI_703]|nr:T5orf172 domain-containing protein [Xylogone sp. PMI_703]
MDESNYQGQNNSSQQMSRPHIARSAMQTRTISDFRHLRSHSNPPDTQYLGGNEKAKHRSGTVTNKMDPPYYDARPTSSDAKLPFKIHSITIDDDESVSLEVDWEDYDWSDSLKPTSLDGDLWMRDLPYRQESKDDITVATGVNHATYAPLIPDSGEPISVTNTTGFLNNIHTAPAQSFAVDSDLRRAILEGVNDEGYIYVLKAPDYFRQNFPGKNPLVKIGMAKDVDARIKSLKSKCGITDLKLVDDKNHRAVHVYWKVEQLVHIELRNFRRVLKCKNCGAKSGNKTEHQEWFEISEELALKTVERWRRFVELNPYDENGALRDFWSSRLKSRDMKLLRSQDDTEEWNERWTRWLDEAIEQMPRDKMQEAA